VIQFLQTEIDVPSSYTIGRHYEGLLRDLVASGRYASASEVLRDGLRLIEEREQFRRAKLEALRAAIREGLESGEAEPFDMDTFLVEARALKSTKHGA
jgi:antitoxin ParD1/3/4